MKAVLLFACALAASPTSAISQSSDPVFHERNPNGSCVVATQGKDGAIVFAHKPGADDATIVLDTPNIASLGQQFNAQFTFGHVTPDGSQMPYVTDQVTLSLNHTSPNHAGAVGSYSALMTTLKRANVVTVKFPNGKSLGFWDLRPVRPILGLLAKC